MECCDSALAGSTLGDAAEWLILLCCTLGSDALVGLLILSMADWRDGGFVSARLSNTAVCAIAEQS